MKKILVFLLLFISCFTIYLVNNTKEVVAATTDSYYSGVENLTGDDLLEKLAQITLTNHTYKTTYDDLRNMYAKTDADPNNPNNIILFYSGASYDSTWEQGNTWNREHVWPKDLANDQYGNNKAGSDIHHIRPTFTAVNSDRGNKKFTDFEFINSSGSEVIYRGYSCGFMSSSYWEPADNVKGDTARILMYMIMHYAKSITANKSFSYAIDINISQVVYAGGGDSKAWELLLQWNKEDSVDDWEAKRNEECAKITGTRNPFIDHPEFADAIWGDGSSVDPSTPSQTTYKVTYNANGGSFSYSDSTKYTSDSLVTQPTPKPAKDGYTFIGWYKEASCTTKWNFATDKITSNLTLYAGYEEVKQNFVDVFKKLSVKSQLTFNVNVASGGGEVQTPTKGVATINTFKTGQSIASSGNYDLSGYMIFDNTLFDIQYKKNSSANGYVNNPNAQIRLYIGDGGKGNSIEITAKSGVKITKVTAIEATEDSSHKVSPTITFNDGKATIQNTASSGQCRLKGFTIEYTVGGSSLSYSLEDESLCLNYVLQLSESAYSLYKQSNKTIDLKINDQAATYVVSKVGNEYRLVYSIKITDYTTLYKPVFSYDGENVTISGYSAKTLAQHYLNNYLSDSLVKQYKSCLEQIVG